jgi:hypothetical protein
LAGFPPRARHAYSTTGAPEPADASVAPASSTTVRPLTVGVNCARGTSRKPTRSSTGRDRSPSGHAAVIRFRPAASARSVSNRPSVTGTVTARRPPRTTTSSQAGSTVPATSAVHAHTSPSDVVIRATGVSLPTLQADAQSARSEPRMGRSVRLARRSLIP